MDDVLKQEVYLKYTKAKKLEAQKNKDDELLKRIPYESEKLIKEYNEKYEKLLIKKQNEILELQAKIEKIKQENANIKQRFLNIPKYIRKFYKV